MCVYNALKVRGGAAQQQHSTACSAVADAGAVGDKHLRLLHQRLARALKQQRLHAQVVQVLLRKRGDSG